MSDFLLFAWLFALVILALGLLSMLTPELAVRYTLWKTRLFGARVAEPGRGTLILYRVQGAAMTALAIFIIVQLLSE